jgi:hypothetical protein
LLGFAATTGGTPIATASGGSYLYAADRRVPPANSGTLETIDLGAPEAERVVNSLPLISDGDSGPEEVFDLVKLGNRVFAGNDLNGLAILDVSEPAQPQLIAHRIDAEDGFAGAIAPVTRIVDAVPRDFMLVAYLYSGGLKAYDVTGVNQPGDAIPEPVHYAPADAYHVTSVAARKDRAFVALNLSSSPLDNRIEVLDISRLPSAPKKLGAVDIACETQGGPGELAAFSHYVLLATTDCVYPEGVALHQGGLRVIDVADPSAPQLIGSLDLDVGTGIPWVGTGVATWNGFAFMGSKSGVQVISLHNPKAPRLVDSLPFPEAFGTCQGARVDVSGNALYVSVSCDSDVAQGHGGVVVYALE